MQESELLVRRIKEGTVIDHIDEGKGLQVLGFLADDDTNKLAVIAPKATINIIKNYKLVEKRRVSLPNEIDRIFRCSNPDCITNSKEHIESVMDVIDKDGRVLKCRYCGRVLDVNRLKYN